MIARAILGNKRLTSNIYLVGPDTSRHKGKGNFMIKPEIGVGREIPCKVWKEIWNSGPNFVKI